MHRCTHTADIVELLYKTILATFIPYKYILRAMPLNTANLFVCCLGIPSMKIKSGRAVARFTASLNSNILVNLILNFVVLEKGE